LQNFLLAPRRVYGVPLLFTFDFFFARNSFAGLVAYRAAGFASGLAGASAFAASRRFLFSRFRNRLYHNRFSYRQ